LEHQKEGSGANSGGSSSENTERLASPGPACPPARDWALYEAGLQSEARTRELLEHVSACSACGALLADMTGDASIQGSIEGESLALKSATASWKRDMVRRLAAESAVDRRRQGPAPWGPRWWAVAAAAAVVVILAGTSSTSVLWLLDRSDRTFEFRAAGSSYRPIAEYRGSTRTEGVSFLAAKLLIAVRARLAPDSAVWLHAQARANLLQPSGSNNLDSAIDELAGARSSTPNDVEILNDLAIALLLRANSDKSSIQVRTEDVSRAIETLSDALKRRQSPELYFNLALAYEQQRAYREALDTWNRYLQIETTGGWADEARRHVQTLRAMLQARRDLRTRRAEDAITALAGQGFRSSADLDASNVANDLAERHGDPWLRDFFDAEHRTPNPRAIENLQASIRAFTAGDASSGETHARQAAAEFSRGGNVAGVELALFEQAYTLQRLSDAKACADLASLALPAAVTGHYRWVEVQLRLTLGICLTMLQHFDTGYEQIMTGQRVAKSAGYSSAELRGLGMASSTLREVGSYREALAFDSQGLQRYWSGEGNRNHAYQFYFGLATSLAGLGYPHAATSPMAEAVQLAAEQSDRSTEAMARARYGTLLMEIARAPEAEQEIARSEQLFDGLPDSPARTLYHSYARLSEARLDAQSNQAERGLQSVTEMEKILSSLQNESIEIDLWHVKSELLTRMGRLADSEDSLRKLLAIGTAATNAAPSASDRSSLARNVSEAVGVLAERYISQGDTREAWRVWTEYNSCFQTVDLASPNSVRLVYATLPSGPVVMVAKAGKVNVVRLPAQTELTMRAAAFRRVLSDPQEPISRVRDLARRARQDLTDPIQGLIVDARTLYIAAEGSFSSVQFGALLSDDGRWFADRYQIIYSPPLGGAPPARRKDITLELPLLAASYGRAAEVLGNSLPALTDLSEELDEATGAFPHNKRIEAEEASPKSLLGALKTSGVFHFSGHTVSVAGDVALVLARDGTENSSERLLWASRIPRDSLGQLRLAVLAACSTGRSDENRYPSADMARAFLLAGVPRVVASSWDVDSRATGELIRGFYRGLRDAASPEQALFASAAALRNQPAYSHPYYWAAFNYFQR
jgi:CHAT domain-containing protein